MRSARSLEDSDIVKENSGLKTEIEKLREDIKRISVEAAVITEENSSLKNALYEHVFNEKNSIINDTTQKLDIFFRTEKNSELNTLTAIEQNVKARIKYIKETLAQNNIDIRNEFDLKLEELSELLDRKVTEARANAAKTEAFSQEEREEFEALKNKEITDEQIRAVAAMRYTYYKLSDLFKGIMIFALGGIMLAAGEILNRKKPNIFSLGISAGGIAILYAALAISYFVLQILGMYPAIIICVLLRKRKKELNGCRWLPQVTLSFFCLII